MKSKPRKKGLRAKLKEAKEIRVNSRRSLDSSRGSASLQLLGARMKVKDVKKREKGSKLPGLSGEMNQAELTLKRTKERTAGKDEGGLRLRETIRENHPLRVIRKHFKGE